LMSDLGFRIVEWNGGPDLLNAAVAEFLIRKSLSRLPTLRNG